jgi:CheY-like chemotaxis protein
MTVLIADDVRLELEIEKTFFQRSGFTVLTATDGLGAVAVAIADRPDLIILDQVMPGLSGIDVCRALKLRMETATIPVIITSSSNAPDIERHCLEAGAHAFVAKSEGREALTRLAALVLQVPERRSARIAAFFSVSSIVGGKETLGRAVDVSEGGMTMETGRRYEPGTDFQLRFLLPGERKENRAGARVVRVTDRADRTFLLTLEFIDMSPEDRKRLNVNLDNAFTVKTQA